MNNADRPIFQPITRRPPSCEQYQMKKAVLFRDGISGGCYWCKTPFADIDEATLEHIIPLADGGLHELKNCAFACRECNYKNVPKTLATFQQLKAKEKMERKRANRIANNSADDPMLECEPFVRKWFDSILHDQRGACLDHARASFLLKSIYKRAGLIKPGKNAVRIFKGHFNRWVTQGAQRDKAAEIERALTSY